MSELGRYLATYYLPRIETDLIDEYDRIVAPPVSSGHLAHMHLHMWKMALIDETYDLERLRTMLLRRKLDPHRLAFIDDLVVRRLAELIAVYGADRQKALYTEVAMALAALHVTSVAGTAA